MEFKEAHYFEAIIDEKYFDRKEESVDVNIDIYYASESQGAYVDLHNLLNNKFASEGFQKPAQMNKAFFITTDKENINEAKKFLTYLFENKDLEASLKQHIYRSSFEDFLEKTYDIYQLEQTLSINNPSKKKIKL
jgi:hypothetical protein